METERNREEQAQERSHQREENVANMENMEEVVLSSVSRENPAASTSTAADNSTNSVVEDINCPICRIDTDENVRRLHSL